MTASVERLGAALADRYRVERELGAGGMAAVYLAEDVRHHRRVALKVLLGAQSFSFSADGRRLAYALLTDSSNVWSLPLEGGSAARPDQITSGQQRIDGISVSRDGAWLYYDSDLAGNGDIYRVRLPSGNPERLTADSINEFAPSVSPDGREIAFHAFGRRDRDIYSMPLDGGPRAVVAATGLQEGLPEWSPDGRSVAFQEIRMSGGAYVVRRGPDGRWSAPRRPANGREPAPT